MERQPAHPCFKLERMVATESKLTERQQAFVAFMAGGQLSATQAYIQAGYSPKGASVQASRSLANTSIQQAIARRKKLMASTERELQVTPQWITSRLAIEATDADTASARVAALRTLADIHGMMSGSQQQLPDALTALVAGIREGHALASKQAVSQAVSPPAIESSYTVTDE